MGTSLMRNLVCGSRTVNAALPLERGSHWTISRKIHRPGQDLQNSIAAELILLIRFQGLLSPPVSTDGQSHLTKKRTHGAVDGL